MKILNNEENLVSFLKSVREQEITVVSAFASGTESVVDLLLEHGNKLELLVGTINAFSSPDFFDHCKNVDNDSFSLLVDFGYQNSIHWKLYLIKPETVIIGSANFTSTGLSLARDTCVLIESRDLLESYIEDLDEIKSSSNVVSRAEAHFDVELQKYRVNHRRIQAGRTRSVQATDGNEWLSAEENQLIPIFIWDSRHTKTTIDEAHELLSNEIDEKPSAILRDFFTYECPEADLPYRQGDLVLCMNNKGSYSDFYSFDRVIHEKGLNYIYSYKRKRYERPFPLNDEIERQIRNRVEDWYEREITELGRSEIQDLIKSVNNVLQRTSR